MSMVYIWKIGSVNMDYKKIYDDIINNCKNYEDSKEAKDELLLMKKNKDFSKNLENYKLYIYLLYWTMENNKNKLDSVVIHSEEFLRHKLDLGVAEIYISALKYNGKIEKAYFKLLEFLKIPEFENFVKNELIDRPAYMLMDVLEGENNYIKIMKTFRKELNFGFEEIDSLLDSIEKNPTKFLKDDKITTLSSFIKGYTFAMSENTMPTYRGVSIFAFSSYLRNKYRDSRSFNEFGFIMEHEKDGKKISAYFRLLGEYREYIKLYKKS